MPEVPKVPHTSPKEAEPPHALPDTPQPHSPAFPAGPQAGLASLIAYGGLNGRRLTLTSDEAYHLAMNVASGHLDTVDEIAAILQYATQPGD